MKHGKLQKLRYNMWFYFIGFSLIIIAVVWIFQILLFDGIFQNKKINALESTGAKLSSEFNTEQEITEETIASWIDSAIEASESGIFSYLVFYDVDAQLQIITVFNAYTNPNTDNNQEVDVDRPIPKNKNDSSSNSPYVPKNEIDSEAISEAVAKFELAKSSYLCYRYKQDDVKDMSCYVYVCSVKNSTIDGYMVLLASQQSLTDTIKIIQLQLLIVSIFVVFVAFFVSMYISKRLSKPITEMSETAKQWANGNEDVAFIGDGYEELNELADALNYAKEGISKTGVLQRDLLANVSHDLKTPLTMIKAYAEMIRDLSGNIKAKRDAHTNVIIDEADRLTMLVNDILDLSKLQNGMNVHEISRFNLSELCQKVIDRFKDFVALTGYTIETAIEPNLFTVADEQKIEQVIYNLIGNSINYTGEDKTIMVRLSVKDKSVYLFETIDTGKGISKEKINSIWDKYYRFSETHQRPVKGTGLGLSIVKTILENHKLKFGVVSKKDIGSNFFIEFKAEINEQV